MSKQDKLELRRDYNDYLDWDQVRRFIDFCEEKINAWDLREPASYLYEYFCFNDWIDWFNHYEHDQFYDNFLEPFIQEHPEYEEVSDEVDEILRELMYDMDKYDSNIEHFDKEYNFYLLTDPCKTFELYDEQIPMVEYKHKYLKSLIRSQGRTANSKSMRWLIYSGWYNGLWICVMLNMSLFDFINLMKAKKLTVKKWTQIYMFNPYIWTGWDTVELTSDRSFPLVLKEIWFGCDNARHWCRGYTPEEVYWRYHPAFNKNRVTFKSFRK